jgi:hypothetical protein
MSENLSNLVLRECRAANFSDCDLVFSGLNSDIAGETGMVPFIIRLLDLLILTTENRDGIHQG